MGLAMPAAAWPDEFIERLVEHGLRVIRFDNRDAGGSSRARGPRRYGAQVAIMRALMRLPVHAPYTLDDMAKDAAGVLDALGIQARARRRRLDGRDDRAGARGPASGAGRHAHVDHVVVRQPESPRGARQPPRAPRAAAPPDPPRHGRRRHRAPDARVRRDRQPRIPRRVSTRCAPSSRKSRSAATTARAPSASCSLSSRQATAGRCSRASPRRPW